MIVVFFLPRLNGYDYLKSKTRLTVSTMYVCVKVYGHENAYRLVILLLDLLFMWLCTS